MKIAIIGGGIGGLTAALALRQVGFESTVFEQAPQLREVGAAIAVWPNALRILQRLGIGEAVLEKAGIIEAITWLKSDGTLLNHIRLPTTDVPAVALHRADLQSALLQSLPDGTVQLNYPFQDYQVVGNEIELTFLNHPSVTCNVLIGADGLHSRTRVRLLSTQAPSFRGYTVWRGITNYNPPSLQRGVAIEVQGRGRRFGIGPVGGGRIGWWASANDKREQKSPGTDDPQALHNLFAGWWTPVVELIEATPHDSILCTPAFDRPAIRKWGEASMTLLGDGIHPTTPNLGQGGCMAIEDAAVLARCIANTTDIVGALRRYETMRYPRTTKIANYSRLYGRVGQWDGRLAVRTRSIALGLMPKSLIRRVLRLIFDYDSTN